MPFLLADMLTKGKVEPPINVNHCYLRCFVRMDMMDLLSRLKLASATLGYKAPGSRRGDGGELELVLFAEASIDQVHIISECPEIYIYFFRAEGKQVEDRALFF